tara:strand:- start:6 stop:383 length:378 start_codon:yes stop_codon:yes gene_type:complete
MKTYTSKILERKRKSRKIRFVSREDAIKKTVALQKKHADEINDLKVKLKLVQKKLKSVYYTKECQFCGQNFKVILHLEKLVGLYGKYKNKLGNGKYKNKLGKKYCDHSCANGAYRRKIWERENAI